MHLSSCHRKLLSSSCAQPALSLTHINIACRQYTRLTMQKATAWWSSFYLHNYITYSLSKVVDEIYYLDQLSLAARPKLTVRRGWSRCLLSNQIVVEIALTPSMEEMFISMAKFIQRFHNDLPSRNPKDTYFAMASRSLLTPNARKKNTMCITSRSRYHPGAVSCLHSVNVTCWHMMWWCWSQFSKDEPWKYRGMGRPTSLHVQNAPIGRGNTRSEAQSQR